MKTIFIIIILAIGGFSLQSQEVVDFAKFRASYVFSYKTELRQTEYYKTDLMYLDIGEKASKFYSRYERIRDSIQYEGIKNNLPINEINTLKSAYLRGTPQIYYHYFKDNRLVCTNRFVFLHTLFEEQSKIPEWSIGNETKEISGYTCQKATAKYLGREWQVYFTSQIPINMGPWKLWGLPGLIVEVSDKDNIFKYELLGFERVQNNLPIVFTHIDNENKEYQSVDKKTYRKMERLYYEDIGEFMKIFLGAISFSVTSEDVSSMEGKISARYIPLEPW